MMIAVDGRKRRLHWPGACRAMLLFAPILLGSLLLGPRPALAEDCVWGQPGYRDCVDKLLAENRKKEAGQESAPNRGKIAPGSVASSETDGKRVPAKTTTKTSGKTAGKSGRRPGAGSLDPVPPAELRLTNPNVDPLQDAIMSERRQRQMEDNRLRYDRPVPSPILPPNYNTTPNTFGRICPQWGC